MATNTYYGKYRAKVVDIADPQKRGRIRVHCPKVLDEAKSAWCETCVPVAGDNEGDFCLPAVGETVWIEFEEGDANRPILSGGWYSKEKSPKKNYGDAPNERIISFKGTRISMREGQCTITTANSTVILKNNCVSITTDGVPPVGDPPVVPFSTVKVDIEKDSIKMSVDTEQVKASLTKDEINFDFKGGNCTGKVAQDLIELQASSGVSKMSMTQDSVELQSGSGSSKVIMSQGKVTVEASGVSCDFTPSSLTELKSLIGG